MGEGVAFLRKKLRKNLFSGGGGDFLKGYTTAFDQLPQDPLSRTIQVIFVGILFAREKNTPENDLDSSRQKAWGKKIEGIRKVLVGTAAPSLQKFLRTSAGSVLFKKRPPGPAGARNDKS